MLQFWSPWSISTYSSNALARYLTPVKIQTFKVSTKKRSTSLRKLSKFRVIEYEIFRSSGVVSWARIPPRKTSSCLPSSQLCSVRQTDLIKTSLTLNLNLLVASVSCGNLTKKSRRSILKSKRSWLALRPKISSGLYTKVIGSLKTKGTKWMRSKTLGSLTCRLALTWRSCQDLVSSSNRMKASP
jgi:hypothetical protein